MMLAFALILGGIFGAFLLHMTSHSAADCADESIRDTPAKWWIAEQMSARHRVALRSMYRGES